MTGESVRDRQKRVEVLRAAGLSERTVAAEVLLLLPESFLAAYEDLFLRVWRAPGVAGGIRVGDPDAENPVATKWRTSSGQTETRGLSSTKGRGSTSKGLGVASIRAEATKQWADRQLRKIAREINNRLTDDGLIIRRCTGPKCKRLAEATWNWCPSCGARTEEWDGPSE